MPPCGARSSRSGHSMPSSSSSRRHRSQRRPTHMRLPRHPACRPLHSRTACSSTVQGGIISPCSQSPESPDVYLATLRIGLGLSSCLQPATASAKRSLKRGLLLASQDALKTCHFDQPSPASQTNRWRCLQCGVVLLAFAAATQTNNQPPF